MSAAPEQVTFVVTTYNYARYVATAIDSVLSQTHPAVDVVVVDDASTDDTAAVLARYDGDARVRVIRHARNAGAVRSWNAGLEAASGAYVALLDADDYAVSSDAVARQVRLLGDHREVGFVYAGRRIVDEDGAAVHTSLPYMEDYVGNGIEEIRERLIWENQVEHSGTMIRRSCLDEVGLHDLAIPHAADWDLWLRLAVRYDVGYIAAPLYAYRTHASNMSHARIGPAQAIRELTRTVDATFDRIPASVPAELREMRGRARRSAALVTLWGDLAYGRTWRAVRGMVAAPIEEPRLVLDRAYYGAGARTAYQAVLGRTRYRRRYGALVH
jgi:GT2 family glycosyltransferase